MKKKFDKVDELSTENNEYAEEPSQAPREDADTAAQPLFDESAAPTDEDLAERQKQRQKKKGKRKSALFTVLLVVCCAVFAVSVFMLARELISYKAGSNDYGELNHDNVYTDAAPQKISWDYLYVDNDALREINSDYYCWIDVPDTRISYPVAAGSNNNYYLYYTFTKLKNPAGAVFADYRCSRRLEGTTINILYGHRMNDGSMFYDLLYYDNEDYFLQHREIDIYVDGGVYVYEIISAFSPLTTDPVYTFEINSASEARAYIAAQLSKSLHSVTVEYDGSENILVLSTCVRNNPSRRFVVVALQKSFTPYPEGMTTDGNG